MCGGLCALIAGFFLMDIDDAGRFGVGFLAAT
jgi:hypothetical protein